MGGGEHRAGSRDEGQYDQKGEVFTEAGEKSIEFQLQMAGETLHSMLALEQVDDYQMHQLQIPFPGEVSLDI